MGYTKTPVLLALTCFSETQDMGTDCEDLLLVNDASTWCGAHERCFAGVTPTPPGLCVGCALAPKAAAFAQESKPSTSTRLLGPCELSK